MYGGAATSHCAPAFVFLLLLSAAFGSDDIDLKMPAAKPSVDDDYVCHGLKVTQPGFIKEFVPVAQVSRVHHLIVFGCSSDWEPPGEVWDCKHMVCEGVVPSILYAWARNAPPLHLPDGVAVAIGGNSTVDYLVLQVHYSLQFIGDVLDYSGVILKVTSDVPIFYAGVFLLGVGMDKQIPPGRNEFAINVSCEYDGEGELHPFAYRTHAHSLGRVITGYRVRGENYHIIGKGNPQWPQLFYPVGQDVPIRKGDVIAAQCIFNSTSRKEVTGIGHHGSDEMCNFYMYYFVAAEHAAVIPRFASCDTLPLVDVFKNYPTEARTPLPRNEQFENEASLIQDRFGVATDLNWMRGDDLKKIGQISCVTVDNDDNLVIFHRADRIWNEQSFDRFNRFRDADSGPIMSNVVAVFNANGQLTKEWGAGLFYLPHGAFVDHNNKIWLTDVAMHQVFRYDWSRDDVTEAELTLGKKMTPGSDEPSFCKPAAVVVASKGGDVYIADGYCNSRLLHYAYDGTFIKAIGISRASNMIPMNVVHDLSINEDANELFVADRANRRVVMFSTNGSTIDSITDAHMTGAVYGVQFCKAGNVLFVLTGRSVDGDKAECRVYAYDASSRSLLYSFRPEQLSFDNTHSIASSKGCDRIYVGLLTANAVIKMAINAMGPPAPHGTYPPEMSGGGLAAFQANPSKQEHRYSAMLLGALGTFVIVLIVMAVMIGCRFVWRQRLEDDHSKHPLLKNPKWRKGFQPLNTEDIDVVEYASDDSEEKEDLLYSPKMTSGS